VIHHGAPKAIRANTDPPRSHGIIRTAGEARWDTMMESIDLLFAEVADVDRVQQQMATQLDISAQLIDQVLKDQQALAKQMEITGQAVA